MVNLPRQMKMTQKFFFKAWDNCSGYNPANIFNSDETGLFIERFLKNHKFTKKITTGLKACKGRITVLLTASMAGEKLRLLVIVKSAIPRCFKIIKPDDLGVFFKSNSKSWITMQIFEEWPFETNKLLNKQNRRILLFKENCWSHNTIKFSHVTFASSQQALNQ